jgi:hypothetical protein
MAHAKSRSLSPIIHTAPLTLKEQVRNLWTSIVAAFIMEEPKEYSVQPDQANYLTPKT